MQFFKKNIWLIPLLIAVIAGIILLVVILSPRPTVDSGETTTTGSAETTTPDTKPTEPFDSTNTLAMPEKTVAFVGQPITIYFLNVTGYNSYIDSGEISYKANTDGKGTIYPDRWEYTPQQEETVKLELSVYDSQGKLLDADSVEIEVRAKSEKDKLSVLVIGDSTINAGTITQTMLDLAKADSYDLTLLGTRGAGVNLHEGRGGWTAKRYAVDTNYAAENPFWNDTTQKFDMRYYMTQQNYDHVDCVVINLGINDTFSAKTDSALETKMKDYFMYMDQIIQDIHTYDSNIKIVWNLITPCALDESKFGTLSQTAARAKQNTYLTNLKIPEKYSDAENVYIAMTNAALDTANNMRDHVHALSAGYKQIGTQLYSFLRGIN